MTRPPRPFLERCPIATWLERLAAAGVLPNDSEETRLRKATLTLASAGTIVAGLIWAGMFAALGLGSAAMWPLFFSATITISLLLFLRLRNFALFRECYLALIPLTPFALQISLGGYANSGAVVVWSGLAPMGGLMFSSARASGVWYAAFVAILVAAAALDGTSAAQASEIGRAHV
mgnify:CR=1 FL=1